MDVFLPFQFIGNILRSAGILYIFGILCEAIQSWAFACWIFYYYYYYYKFSFFASDWSNCLFHIDSVLASLMFLEICLCLLGCHITVVFFYDFFFNLCGISFYFFSLISYFIYLSSHPLFLISLAKS